MSASAYLRGNAQGIFFTRDYLAHLDRIGMRVINGCKAFSLEISKAAQLALLHSLGLAKPRSRIVNYATQAVPAAQEIGFPVIVKPNIGGRGAGIMRFDSAPALERAAATGEIGFGIDNTALVQEFLPVRGRTYYARRDSRWKIPVCDQSRYLRRRTLICVRLRYAGPKTAVPV